MAEAWATVAATPWPPAVEETPCPAHAAGANPWRFPVKDHMSSADAYWNDRLRRYHDAQRARG